jgi:hypothetical protein
MKTCPYCGREYPDDATVCTIDQNLLVPAVAAAPAPVAPPSATKASQSPDEAGQLRTQAEKFQFWSLILFAAGLLCWLGAIFSFVNSGGLEAGVPWHWGSIGGSLISASVLLFFFAQLIHIRALLAKK